MTKSVKVAVIVEGGCVTAVLSAGIPVESVVVDYDVDGSMLDELADIPQSDGTIEKGWRLSPCAKEDTKRRRAPGWSGFANYRGGQVSSHQRALV